MTYVAEFLDSETDDVVETFTFEAGDDNQAEALAWEEAEYQGYHVGTVKAVSK